MSTYVPPIPRDDVKYTLKGLNGAAVWESDETPQTPETPEIPEPPVVVKPKKYMLIEAGQSNCQSSNDGPLNALEKNGDPRIKAFYRGIAVTFDGISITNYPILPKGSIGPAIEPLQHHGISNKNSVGFGLTFCNEFLKDHPNSEITIMPCALGGTSFRPSVGYVISWDKTVNAHKNLYNEMIEDCNTVLQANPDMEVLGMCFHQGESDVGNWEYPTKLDKFVRDTRVDLWNDKGANMPFVCGTMLASWKALNNQTQYIDMAHKNIKWRFNDDNTECAWFDWLTDENVGPPHPDGMRVHYNAVAQRYMGMGYYAVYKKLKGAVSNSRSLTRGNKKLSRMLSHSDSPPNYNECCKILAENEGKFPEE
jgi:hypothetical protein